MTKIRLIFAGVLAFLLLGLAAGFGGLSYLGYFSTNAVTIISPNKERADYTIVFLSGDLGFNAGTGPKLLQHFTDEGVPVVALNSLTFFRHERTRAEVDKLVRDLMNTARDRFGHRRLVLIGHSFGADALQLALTDLSVSERNDIMQVVMIVPTDDVYLQAQPDGHYSSRPADFDAVATAHMLDWVPVLCIHGETEKGSLCPKLNLDNADIATLPGGHNLKLDDGLIYQTIQQAIDAIGLRVPQSAPHASPEKMQ